MSIRRMLERGASAIVLLVGPAALAGSFEFTTLLNSKRDGLEPTRCAAINTQGTVVVQVRDPVLGINKVITKRTAHDVPVVIADTQRVPDFPTFCDNGINQIASDPTINEVGEVAIQGNVRRLTTRAECGTLEQRRIRQAVLLGNGGPITVIAHSINPPGGNVIETETNTYPGISEFLVADHSVNDSGEVAFIPELDGTFDQGLFVGSKGGRFEKRFLVSEGPFGGVSSRVSLNDLGQIAFQSTVLGPFPRTSGIFLSNPDGTFTTIADSTGEIDSFDAPSLNNSGTVAFNGSKFVDGVQVLGVFTSAGGPVTTVADSTGRYSSFREPSLNDLGQVAFTADLDETGPDGSLIQGVFTGGNPDRDVVLKSGDKYDGKRVTNVFTCSEALNNNGEIVMTVQSQSPETFEVQTFIVKATPKK